MFYFGYLYLELSEYFWVIILEQSTQNASWQLTLILTDFPTAVCTVRNL